MLGKIVNTNPNLKRFCMLKFSFQRFIFRHKLNILFYLLTLLQFSSVLAQSEFPYVPDTVKSGTIIKQLTKFKVGDKLVDAECGYIIVPENRSNPNSNLIKVAFVRFKSKLRKSLPPVFFLGGGPGSESIQFARRKFIFFNITRWIAGDVIIFDQRGVGESLPSLSCHEYDFQHDKPYSREEINQHIAQTTLKCRERLINQGIDLTGYNTCEIVEDIETIRLGLGYEKINLLSVSYGTLVAYNYIKKHESKVNRAIFDGFQNPSQPYFIHPAIYQRKLEQLAELCAKNQYYSEHKLNFLKTMEVVLANLAVNPVQLTIPHPETGEPTSIGISKAQAQYATYFSMGFRDGIEMIPIAFYKAQEGDYTKLAQLILQLPSFPSHQGMAASVVCSEGLPEKYAPIMQAEAKESILEDIPMWMGAGDICSIWGVTPVNSSFLKPVSSKVPVLFINGTLDPITPIENTFEIIDNFPNARHLILEGGAHYDHFVVTLATMRYGLKFLCNHEVNSKTVKVTIKFKTDTHRK